MEIGAHVSSSGGLLSSLDRGTSIGADVVQIFTQSPRMWRAPSHAPETLAAYRAAQEAHPSVTRTYCHATYLVNLAASDPGLADRSTRCLVENLLAATAIGSRGLVLHVGSHRGAGLDAVIDQIVRSLCSALDETEDVLGTAACPLLLENAAGAGGTVGRSFAELGAILDTASGDRRLGVCLDTQHLFASGVGYGTLEEADLVIDELDRTVGLDRLGCIHLNDSKVGLGANRDRHENLGEGEIGSEALACLLGHPALEQVPAILEVPGAGDGPRAEDVTTARRVLAVGREKRVGAPL